MHQDNLRKSDLESHLAPFVNPAFQKGLRPNTLRQSYIYFDPVQHDFIGVAHERKNPIITINSIKKNPNNIIIILFDIIM